MANEQIIVLIKAEPYTEPRITEEQYRMLHEKHVKSEFYPIDPQDTARLTLEKAIYEAERDVRHAEESLQRITDDLARANANLKNAKKQQSNLIHTYVKNFPEGK